MFRWMASRPALFFAGLTVGVSGAHHFEVTVSGPEPKSAVAAATDKAAPVAAPKIVKITNVAKTPQRYQPLPVADDQVERLQIPRIGDFSGAKRVAAANNPVEEISKVRRANIAKRTSPAALRALARNIQSELVRTGCGSIAVSGRWDSRTVRASAKFLSNRNALLPSDRPDVVLLSMLRGYKGRACGLDERNEVATGRMPSGAAHQPITIRSASMSDATYVSRPVGGASPITAEPNASPAINVGTIRTKPRPAPVRTRVTRVRQKKKISWRQKVHYGNGSDN